MQDKIFSLIVEQNEISWKSIIYELVRQEGMDPWDIDISGLAELYIKRVKAMHNVDLKLSGKVLLAAAILLKIKSKRLVNEDLNEFDRLIASAEESEQFYDELEHQLAAGERQAILENVELHPRTPQPRARKVSVYDLIKALEKALEVKKRRLLNNPPPLDLKIPQRTFDLGEATGNLHQRIINFYNDNNMRLTFTHILGQNNSKLDKIYTFIPLLHLHHQQKVELNQEKHFGEIHIDLLEETNAHAE